MSSRPSVSAWRDPPNWRRFSLGDFSLPSKWHKRKREKRLPFKAVEFARSGKAAVACLAEGLVNGDGYGVGKV